jgi:hypothetical protein
MVYLYEIADPRYKAVTGSLGYISLGAGVVLGILVVAAIISAIPECESTRGFSALVRCLVCQLCMQHGAAHAGGGRNHLSHPQM